MVKHLLNIPRYVWIFPGIEIRGAHILSACSGNKYKANNINKLRWQRVYRYIANIATFTNSYRLKYVDNSAKSYRLLNICM